MTLITWKAEFYPKSAKSPMGKLAAIEHSLRKWRGLTRDNLKKHKLSINKWAGILDDIDNLKIDSTSCALCSKYYDGLIGCPKCPLSQYLGYRCDQPLGESVYSDFIQDSNPKPMIKALEGTLRMVKNEP